MIKIIEVKAPTLEDAIERGLKEMGVKSREDVEIEVIAKGGLFQKAVVKMSKEQTVCEVVEDFINGTLAKMNIQSQAIAIQKDDTIYVEIEGDDASRAIGYRGEALDALQYLALTMVNNGESFFKVVVNAESYREKRTETLVNLAKKLAYKANNTGRKVVLEPMNPFERRIIHTTLQDSGLAKTESEGEEPNRHVVIYPNERRAHEQGERSERPYREGGNRPYNRDNRGGQGNRNGSRDNRGRDGRSRDDRPVGQSIKHDSIGKLLSDENLAPVEKKSTPGKFKSFGQKKGF